RRPWTSTMNGPSRNGASSGMPSLHHCAAAALPGPGEASINFRVPAGSPMSLVASFRLVFAPPHPAGRPFLLGGAAVCVLGLVLAAWLAWLGALFVLFC